VYQATTTMTMIKLAKGFERIRRVLVRYGELSAVSCSVCISFSSVTMASSSKHNDFLIYFNTNDDAHGRTCVLLSFIKSLIDR
jgi:hypothetical protein